MHKTIVSFRRPELKTREDYIKERDKSKNDFEQFVKRRESNIATLSYQQLCEQKQM